MERRGFLGALGAIGAAIVGRKALPPITEPTKAGLAMEPATVALMPTPDLGRYGLYIDMEAGERLDAGELCYVRSDDGKVYRDPDPYSADGMRPFGIVTAERITAQAGGRYQHTATVKLSSTWTLPDA